MDQNPWRCAAIKESWYKMVECLKITDIVSLGRWLTGRAIGAVVFFSLLGGEVFASFVPKTRIEHAPPAYVLKAQRVRFKAQIFEPKGFLSIRCYFRYEPGMPYLFVEMTPASTGYECTLPTPSAAVQKIDYQFVVVNSERRVMRTVEFHTSVVTPSDENRSSPNSKITIQSDMPITRDLSELFSNTDQPVYESVTPQFRFGVRVGIYDLSSNPDYRSGFFGGFLYDQSLKTMVPVKGYAAFPTLQGLLSEKSATATDAPASTYPDINGEDWSGYFYKATESGDQVSDPIPVTAMVVHDGNGNAEITILSNQGCPGRNFFDHGILNPDGDIAIYDVDCDNELWTTHWNSATSTFIQIADYIDIDIYGYQYLYVLELTRPEPVPVVPVPAAPTLTSPADGSITSFVETLLEWNTVDYAVNFQVQRGSSCDSGLLYETTVLAYAMKNITPDEINYWKVRAQNSAGAWGEWSECWSFKTRPKGILTPQYLLLIGNYGPSP